MSSYNVVSLTFAPSVAMSQVDRIINTFVNPSKAFAQIIQSAGWGLPFLLLVILSTSSTFVVEKRVGFDQVFQNEIHASPGVEERINALPPEQRASALSQSARRLRITAYLSPLSVLMSSLFYSLIIWGTFSVGMESEVTYKQVVAVNWYSILPYLLLPIMTIMSLYAGSDAATFNPQNAVGTNVGYYFPNLGSALTAVLNSLDVLKMWSHSLMALGMSIVARKSLTSAGIVIFGYWIAGVLVAVAIGTAFS